MENTHGEYRNSGQALLQGLDSSRKPRMVGTSHGEHDHEDLEVKFI
jgi:hypothetical protein